VGRIKRGDGEDGDPVGAHHAGPDARQVSRWSARVSRYRGTRRQLLAEMPHHNEPRTSLKRCYVKRSLVEWWPFSGSNTWLPSLYQHKEGNVDLPEIMPTGLSLVIAAELSAGCSLVSCDSSLTL